MNTPACRVILLVTECICSMFNCFSLHCFYKCRPHHPPTTEINLNAQYAPEAEAVASRKSRQTLKEILSPFPNLSTFLFTHHHASSPNKSLVDRAALQVTLTHPDFKVEDIAGVNFKKPDKQLVEGDTASDLPNLEPQDGWQESNITIGILSGQESTLAL